MAPKYIAPCPGPVIGVEKWPQSSESGAMPGRGGPDVPPARCNPLVSLIEPMQLEVNGTVVDAPLTMDLIEQVIFDLTGNVDSFVILSRDQMTYIQAAGGAGSGLLLEYQEGSLDKHYSCSELDLNTSQVIQAFQRYLAGDTRWKTELAWTREDAGTDASPAVTGKLIACAVLLIVALSAWLLLA